MKLIYFIANNVAASANSGTPMHDYHDMKQRGSKSHTQIASKYTIKFNLKCEWVIVRGTVQAVSVGIISTANTRKTYRSWNIKITVSNRSRILTENTMKYFQIEKRQW